MSPEERREGDARITKALAEVLGLDPSIIRGCFTADWSSGDEHIVLTWTGIKLLPIQEYRDLLEQVLTERESNG